MKTTKTIFLILFLIPMILSGNPEKKDTTSFIVKTYDGLELPAQIINPAGDTPDKIIVFINGSTPYNENGKILALFNEKGQVLVQKQDFYVRFPDFMSARGYAVATMAKRSFVQPAKIPRPTLDELALDIVFLIQQLKSQNIYTKEKKLYLVGYSEGSIVASKVLGWLKEQPEACILLGTGSNVFDYHNKSWQDWPDGKMLRKLKNWTDEQIQQEFNEWKDIVMQLRNMDEDHFENEYKKSKPHGFGFAPWESFYIDREVNSYCPEYNLLDANIPLLICIGENDMAMPEKQAALTHQNLLNMGFTKATYRVIPEEVHQYKKPDVFGIINQWISSGFTSVESTPNVEELEKTRWYEQQNERHKTMTRLPYVGSPQEVLKFFLESQKLADLDPHEWFSLGVKLFGNNLHDEAYTAFSNAEKKKDMFRSPSLVWLGHLNDLKENRTLALSQYSEALKLFPGFPIQHDQWKMVIDESWINERIKQPFSMEMLKK